MAGVNMWIHGDCPLARGSLASQDPYTTKHEEGKRALGNGSPISSSPRRRHERA